MKSKIKLTEKLTAIILLVTLSLMNMSACSSGAHSSKESKSSSITPEEYTITGQAVRCDGESLSMPIVGIRLILATKSASGVFMYGLDDDETAHFFQLETDGLKVKELNGFDGEKVEAISASNNGELHVLRVAENGDYIISSLSQAGELSSITVDLSAYDDNMIYSFYAVDDGFFLDLSSHIAVIDKSGKIIHSYDEFTGAQKVVVMQGKTLLINTATQASSSVLNQTAGTEIIELSSDFEATQSYHVEPMFTNFYAGADNQLLALMNNVVYEYDYISGSSEALVNTSSSNIDSASFISLAEDLYFSLNRGEAYVWRPASQEGVTTLTFATYNLSYEMEESIRLFNLNNSSYQIETIDYAAYDTYDSSDTGLTRLANDIISGNAPDIYDLSYFSPESFAAKGLLEDLKPYFESDSKLSYDSLLPCITANTEFRDGLYELVPSFKLVTLCGDKATVGDDWSVEKFIQLTKEYPHEMILGLDMTRGEFMNYVLSFMKSELYSEETLQCNFTSEDFISMLEYTASLPASFNYDGSQGERMGRAYAGEQVLVINAFGYEIVDEISLLSGIFGGKAQFVGFPTDSGSGIGIKPSERLGMSSASANKDGVWEFFRFLLSDAVLVDAKIFDIPSTVSAFEKSINKQIDSAIKNLPLAYGASTEGPVEISGVPVDREQMTELINDMVSRADCITVCDSSILTIILSCAEGYFQGGKTIESATNEMQSKISIYLAEQYG